MTETVAKEFPHRWQKWTFPPNPVADALSCADGLENAAQRAAERFSFEELEINDD
ncbi:hypothetical protein [Streptomyces sp. ERV7]|uniref:hypothetical protein n=1 Tax=Streptomyces sp. ERV7 TaxID=1322334 RepID=UPI00131AE08A|nr:hypothetical protein [Streptomyces sp. ERV7]